MRTEVHPADEIDRLRRRVADLERRLSRAERTEATTAQFFTLSPALMVFVGFNGVIARVNQAFCTHLDAEEGEVVGRPLLDFVHPDDATSVSEQLAAVGSGHTVVSFQARTFARDGRVGWIELSGAGVAEAKQIFFTGVDITNRRQTDQALRKSEQRFRELAENISEVFWLADVGLRRLLYVSPAYEPLWGRRLGDHSRRPWVEAIHPDDRARAEQAFQHLIEEGDMDIEYRIVRPDGSQRWIHDRGYPVMSSDGAVTRIAGIASDITARKTAEHALQSVALGTASASSGESFFQTLMHHLSTALHATDAWLAETSEAPDQLRLLAWWSQGRARPEKTLAVQMLPCDDVLTGRSRWIAHGAGRRFSHELLQNREAYMAVPLIDSTGKGRGLLAVARVEPLEHMASVDNIVQIFAARAAAELERRDAEALARKREEELAHVGRLQTIGEMASGIAHELNQPLLAIMNHAAAARLGLSEEQREPIEGDLGDIELQAERAAAIIHRLRSFVQRQPTTLALIDLNCLVQDVLHFMMVPAQRVRASMISQLDHPAPTALADQIQLEQVLVNLVSNALEAIRDLPEPDRVVTVRTIAYSRYVLVAVDDLGHGPAVGMNPFEPFVSTKTDGLGVGLSISRSIIERHRGHIWHERRLPAGCRFAFRLPVEHGDPTDKDDAPLR